MEQVIFTYELEILNSQILSCKSYLTSISYIFLHHPISSPFASLHCKYAAHCLSLRLDSLLLESKLWLFHILSPEFSSLPVMQKSAINSCWTNQVWDCKQVNSLHPKKYYFEMKERELVEVKAREQMRREISGRRHLKRQIIPTSYPCQAWNSENQLLFFKKNIKMLYTYKTIEVSKFRWWRSKHVRLCINI